jgi:hypothetical protein
MNHIKEKKEKISKSIKDDLKRINQSQKEYIIELFDEYVTEDIFEPFDLLDKGQFKFIGIEYFSNGGNHSYYDYDFSIYYSSLKKSYGDRWLTISGSGLIKEINDHDHRFSNLKYFDFRKIDKINEDIKILKNLHREIVDISIGNNILFYCLSPPLYEPESLILEIGNSYEKFGNTEGFTFIPKKRG